MVTCRLVGRNIRSLAWRWPKAKYIALAYFIPVTYATIAYGAVWGLRLGGRNSKFVTQAAQDFGLRGMPTWGSLAL